jgi:hypothetical protein
MHSVVRQVLADVPLTGEAPDDQVDLVQTLLVPVVGASYPQLRFSPQIVFSGWCAPSI